MLAGENVPQSDLSAHLRIDVYNLQGCNLQLDFLIRVL